MLLPLALGLTMVVVNVVVQTLAVLVVVGYLALDVGRRGFGISWITDGARLIGVVLMMFVGHLIQMATWAWVFLQLGEFDEFAAAFYHSAVNFTSLGYGDIVMSERWRLLGPLQTGCGMLMFGVSTALFFAMVTRILSERQRRRHSASS